MCKVTILRELVKRKLNVAVEEIFELFERTIAEYEEEFRRSKEASERRHREELEAAVVKPRGARQSSKSREKVAPEDEEPPAKRKKDVGRTGLRSSQRKATENNAESSNDSHSPPDYLAPISDMDDSDYDDNGKGSSGTNQTLNCSECSQTFVCKEDLAKHVKTHTGVKSLNPSVVNTVKSFTCSVCDTSFPSRDILISHIRTHTQVKPASSSSSSQQATKEAKASRSRPNRSATKDTPEPSESNHADKEPSKIIQKLKCSECSETFLAKEDLDKHARSHTGKKLFTCSVCSKSLPSRELLISHIRGHTEEDAVASTSSNQTVAVTDGKNLQSQPDKSAALAKPSKTPTNRDISHLRAHARDKPKASTSSSQNIALNLQPEKSTPTRDKDDVTSDSSDSDGDSKKASKPSKNFKRSTCSETFPRKDDLDAHITTLGESKSDNCVGVTKLFYTVQSLTCTVCTKRFSAIDHLVAHMKEHGHGKPAAAAGSSRAAEMNGEHGEDPQSEPESLFAPLSHSDMTSDSSDGDPDNSGASVATSKTSEGDARLEKRNSERSFACPLCEKSFYRKHHLTRHLKMHAKASSSNSKAGEGSQTSAKEASKTTNKSKGHERKSHLRCSHCKKKFRHMGHLTQHMVVHQAESPFACQFCHEKFGFPEALRKHIADRH